MKSRVASLSKRRRISTLAPRLSPSMFHSSEGRISVAGQSARKRTRTIRPFSSWIPDPISHATGSLHYWQSPSFTTSWPLISLWKPSGDDVQSKDRIIHEQKDRLSLILDHWKTHASSSLSDQDWHEAQSLLQEIFGENSAFRLGEDHENIACSSAVDQMHCQEELIRDGFLLLDQMALILEEYAQTLPREKYLQLPTSILYDMMNVWTKMMQMHAESYQFRGGTTEIHNPTLLHADNQNVIPQSVNLMKGWFHWFQIGLFRQPEANEVSFWLETVLRMTTIHAKDYQQTVELANWVSQSPDYTIHWTEQCLEYYLIALNHLQQPLQCETALLKWHRLWIEDTIEYARSATPRHFNLVLKTWAEDSNKGFHSVERIQDLIRQMESSKIPTNIDSNDALLQAYVRHIRHQTENPQSTTKAEVLHHMEEMETIFEQMKKLARTDASYSPTVDTFNCLVEANAIIMGEKEMKYLQRSQALVQEMQTAYKLKPSLHTYLSLMAAFAKTNRVEKTEELYQRIIRLYKGGDPAFCPTRQLHTTRIWAWSRAGNPEQTTTCLSEMQRQRSIVLLHEDFHPKTHDFNAILSAWLRSKRGDEAALNALYLLKQMKRHYERGKYNCPPDATSYNIALATFNRYNAPGSARIGLQILQRLEHLVQMEPQNAAVRPSLETYKHILVALIRQARDEESYLSEIHNLLQVLSDQPCSFWPENPAQTGMCFAWIKDEMERSKLDDNEREGILSAIQGLEGRVESFLN